MLLSSTLFRNPFFNTFMKEIGKNDQLYLSVKEEELTWIRKLCGDDFTAALSKGIKEKGKIRFISGHWSEWKAWSEKSIAIAGSSP